MYVSSTGFAEVGITTFFFFFNIEDSQQPFISAGLRLPFVFPSYQAAPCNICLAAATSGFMLREEKPDEGDSLFAAPQLGTRLIFSLDKLIERNVWTQKLEWHWKSHVFSLVIFGLIHTSATWISHRLFRQVLVFLPLMAIFFSRRREAFSVTPQNLFGSWLTSASPNVGREELVPQHNLLVSSYLSASCIPTRECWENQVPFSPSHQQTIRHPNIMWTERPQSTSNVDEFTAERATDKMHMSLGTVGCSALCRGMRWSARGMHWSARVSLVSGEQRRAGVSCSGWCLPSCVPTTQHGDPAMGLVVFSALKGSCLYSAPLGCLAATGRARGLRHPKI